MPSNTYRPWLGRPLKGWLIGVSLGVKLLLVAEKTLFQKIMDREEPGDIVYEDDLCVALRDINPQAPTHVLVVPRKPIPNLDALTQEDEPLVGHRSEEHTSELQSRQYIVCRLLLEKKN